MSIDSTYREVLVEDFIRTQLQQGQSVTTGMVLDYINSLNDQDLTKPKFLSSDFQVEPKESASATKFNNTFTVIKNDFRVLYQEMIRLSRVATRTYERWNIEAQAIEKQLIDLEDDIENLLLIAQDTDGYHNFLVENFTDLSMTDLALCSTRIDLKGNIVLLQSQGEVEERIFLNNLDPNKDVTFRVQNTVGYAGRLDSAGRSMISMFRQGEEGWWTSIEMTMVRPVTAELIVQISNSDPINLNRIRLELHDSGQSGPVQVTPLYSIDNVNWQQVPSNTFTMEIRSVGSFVFTPILAKWIKFVLIKPGPDPRVVSDKFSYQFGFKEISFFKEGYQPGTIQQFISRPLYILDLDNNIVSFEKLLLQTCECIEPNTLINYYITTSNDPDVPVNNNTVWVPISPINDLTPIHDQMLNVGDTVDITWGDTEGVVPDSEIVKISYQAIASDEFINPSEDFEILHLDSSDNIEMIAMNATSRRYIFTNPEDRILNLELRTSEEPDSLNINLDSLVILRNVGTRNLDLEDSSSWVRNNPRGWSFSDPWYSCVVQILNPEGISIDVGDSDIIIDDIRYQGVVPTNVLTGQTSKSSGLHTVSVHKNNWKYVTANDITDLDSLKNKDILYPYNHKLLIEGFTYPVLWDEERIYRGVDLFAELVMKRIGVTDLVRNINSQDYRYYALDQDAPATHNPANNLPHTVFLVKVDNENPDFQYERFVIRFSLINQLRKYLRLRADLKTEDPGISPVLHSYKIKLG